MENAFFALVEMLFLLGAVRFDVHARVVGVPGEEWRGRGLARVDGEKDI
jgi:hypothetical protein